MNFFYVYFYFTAPIKRSVPYYVIFVELSLTGEPELTSLQKQVEEQVIASHQQLDRNNADFAVGRCAHQKSQ